MKITHAKIVKAKLTKKVAAIFQKNDNGQFEDSCELKVNIQYQEQKFKSLSKGFLVSDLQDQTFQQPSGQTAPPQFYIVFRDEIAHNLTKFGNIDSKIQTDMNEEQFDIQIGSSKDSDQIVIEMTLRENYQTSQG